MTKSELLDKIKRAEKNPLIDASLKASLLKKYNAQLAELEKEEPKKESKSEGSVGKKSKIKDWYLKEYSSDKLGKKLNDDSTFSDLLIAISKGNDVYAVLGVADSVVRERAFAKLSKIENKEGQWAYNTWLSHDEDSEGKKETSKAKTDDLASVRVIANEMAKNAGFKSAKVDDLGNEAYLIEISPSSTKDDSQDGMVLNKYKDGTFEVAEMQAGKGGNFINVFGEYKTLKPALTQLLKGNKQKPIKVIDMRSDSEKSENKKEPSAKYKVGDILWHDTKHKGEFKKVIIDAVTGFTGDGHRYDVEFVDDEDKRINKFAKSYDDLLSKTKPKSEDKKETSSKKIKLKEIKIHWAEGDNSKYDKFPKMYSTWSKSNDAIIPILKDNKSDGGYNKVKFTVFYEDGETYDGRLDVSETEDNPTKTHNVIGQHIKDFLDYELSEKSKSSAESKKEVKEWLEKYDLGLSSSKETVNSENKKEAKSEETEEERCQKIIRDAKAASKKARESAKKSAKKPEVTKAKERIERTYEIIENKIEKGSLTKAEVAKLIVETKEVLKMLEKALKSL